MGLEFEAQLVCPSLCVLLRVPCGAAKASQGLSNVKHSAAVPGYYFPGE